MKTYTIKPKQWNFRPRESVLPICGVNSFLIESIFDESCYYSYESWDFDKDWVDLNKVKGLTRYLSPNDWESCMLAWRPGNITNTISLFAYVNYPCNTPQYVPLRTIPVNRYSKCLVTLTGEEAQFDLIYNTMKSTAKLPFKKFKMYREVGTSFGGKNNSSGKFGGRATQYMSMQLSLTINPDGVT